MSPVAVGRTHGGAAARLTLGGGKGNILSGAVMRELRAALAAAASDRSVKIVVIAGEGKHFSFGASVEEHTREHATAMIAEFHGLILDVARLPVPVAACVSGMCLGGAMELAMACSIVFADATAVFSQPEISLGVFAPPASVLLPLRLGYARAEEILLTGEQITAERAREIGLVNRVFANADALRSGADEWIAGHIVPKSAAALRFATRAGRARFAETLAASLPQLERLYIDELMATNDANEGIAAFLEKRKPVWKNE